MTASTTAVTAAEAEVVARELYGLDATATPLPGERDRNFRLRAADGASFVLKLHHPDSDPAELDLQDAALQHLAGMPGAAAVQRVVPTLAGAPQGRCDAGDSPRVVRMLTWLAGRPWRDAGPHDGTRMADLGRLVARVDAGLAGFGHPAMRRPLRWNVTSAGEVAAWTSLVDAGRRPVVDAVFDRFRAVVAPRLAALPHQVVHNDANEFNVLIGPDGGVTGLIDFGDVVWSPRVAGPAVAGAYAMQGHPGPVKAGGPPVLRHHEAAPPTPPGVEGVFDPLPTPPPPS